MMKKDKKFNYIDLFAGCGGLSDGFEQTGNYKPLACVEWDKAACATLAKRLKDKWSYTDAEQRVIRFDIQRTDELIEDGITILNMVHQ
jgi:DNA (cytosine-5)-methyltransferase 1